MNLLLFCSNPVDGGTARIFYELVTALREAKGRIRVFPVVNVGNSVKIYKEIDDIFYIPVYSEQRVFKDLYQHRGFFRLIDYFRRKVLYRKTRKSNIQVMIRYLQDNNIGAVMIHNGGYVGDDLCNQLLEAAYLCRRSIPIRIMVWHSDMQKNLFKKVRYFFYDKKIDREATALITVSHYTRNRIMQSSFINHDISVIYNGISDARKKATRDLFVTHADSEEFQVLMIGNFTANKGQIKLVEAMRLLSDVPVHATIIGNVYDIDYYKTCLDLIKKSGLDERIKIYEGIYDAYEYIEDFDVLVVTSMYDESFGLISLEAMIAGKPVIAFECGGIPEVIEDGKTGWLLPLGDSEKLAERIRWCSFHRAETEKIGVEGRKLYQRKFSRDIMKAAYLKYLQDQTDSIKKNAG